MAGGIADLVLMRIAKPGRKGFVLLFYALNFWHFYLIFSNQQNTLLPFL